MSIEPGSRFKVREYPWTPGQNKVEIKLKKNPEAAKTSEQQFRAVFSAAVFLNFSSQIRQNTRKSLSSSCETTYAKFVSPFDLGGRD
jgi:hypothetical protein